MPLKTEFTSKQEAEANLFASLTGKIPVPVGKDKIRLMTKTELNQYAKELVSKGETKAAREVLAKRILYNEAICRRDDESDDNVITIDRENPSFPNLESNFADYFSKVSSKSFRIRAPAYLTLLKEAKKTGRTVSDTVRAIVAPAISDYFTSVKKEIDSRKVEYIEWLIAEWLGKKNRAQRSAFDSPSFALFYDGAQNERFIASPTGDFSVATIVRPNKSFFAIAEDLIFDYIDLKKFVVEDMKLDTRETIGFIPLNGYDYHAEHTTSETSKAVEEVSTRETTGLSHENYKDELCLEVEIVFVNPDGPWYPEDFSDFEGEDEDVEWTSDGVRTSISIGIEVEYKISPEREVISVNGIVLKEENKNIIHNYLKTEFLKEIEDPALLECSESNIRERIEEELDADNIEEAMDWILRNNIMVNIEKLTKMFADYVISLATRTQVVTFTIPKILLYMFNSIFEAEDINKLILGALREGE